MRRHEDMTIMLIAFKVLRDVGKVGEIFTVLTDAVNVANFVLADQFLLGTT